MKKQYQCLLFLCAFLMNALLLAAPNQDYDFNKLDQIANLIKKSGVFQRSESHLPITNAYKTVNRDSQIVEHLEKTGQLSMAIFTMPVMLNGISYDQILNASWSNFLESFEEYHIYLKEGGKFNNSVFHKEATFHKLRSEGPCDFSMTVFKDNVSFFGSLFLSAARFDGDDFFGDAVFSSTDFDGTVTFSHSNFHRNISLNHASFLHGFDLSFAKIDNVDMFHTQVAGILNLQHAEVNGRINLLSVEPIRSGEKILINLAGDDVTKIDLNYNNFKLDFPVGTKKSEVERVYSGLLKKFESNGDTVSYNALYEEYSEYLHLNNNSHIKLFLGRYVWNFGLEKARVFVWLALLFAIYATINCIFYRELINDYIDIDFLNMIDYTPADNLNKFQKIVFYTPYSLVLTFALCICWFLPGMGISTQNLKGKSLTVTSYLMLLPVTGFIFITFIIIFILRA